MANKITFTDRLVSRLRKKFKFNIRTITQTCSWHYFAGSIDLASKINRNTDAMIDKYGEKETMKAVLLSALEYLSGMSDEDKTELLSSFLNELFFRICDEKGEGYGE